MPPLHGSLADDVAAFIGLASSDRSEHSHIPSAVASRREKNLVALPPQVFYSLPLLRPLELRQGV
jgi:hypothetical protein